MSKIAEIIESQKKLGSELEQLYRVTAAEASSLDSAQLQNRKEKLNDIANTFNNNETKLSNLVEGKKEAKSLPYFKEKYGDQKNDPFDRNDSTPSLWQGILHWMIYVLFHHNAHMSLLSLHQIDVVN
ncbi:hypothetical protein ACLKA6_010084 [Drosophila palustris]